MHPKECETLIRSVLNSMSTDVSISRLVEDFLDLVGIEIPFKIYGFPTLVEYLNSMHWILHVDLDDDIIQVIPSKKSEHIYRMIQDEMGRDNWDKMKKEFTTRCL
ncbi:PREDICTED: uncharacterized protein LOC108558629 [Nicrophorus vespilloides]|uniref:Uncharacterized protein LOC108558629 n=1 Tax=Nicrophorus vespilloides TaxID=110193 RepID=A0ABM1M948_NICVS|nr:PREDICTED: uncharacterized protein LOC108558629 [Nicrophorus vespilloides]